MCAEAAQREPAHAYRRIAAEEAFATPDLFESWRRALESPSLEDPAFRTFYGPFLSAPVTKPLRERLLDLGDARIREMDAAGVDIQLLSVTTPGVQVLPEEVAVSLARDLNDELAQRIADHRDRFAALATVAPQHPEQAARELERSVREHGFHGAIVNSSTRGGYLYEPRYEPLLAAAEALDVPIYLHPATPSPQMAEPYLVHGLEGPMWGFAAETSLHALRLILGGVFDRHPGLRIVLGHLGEGLPFWLPRIDGKHAMFRQVLGVVRCRSLERAPSEYFKDRFWITTSGVHWPAALRLAIEVMGTDRVLFAADHPYESSSAAVLAIESLGLTREDRCRLFEHNARSVFRL